MCIRDRIITSPMGGRVSPGGIGSTNHRGVDIGGVGTTSAALATKSGKVIIAKTVVYGSYGGSGYGNYVVLDHGGGYTTLYAHLSSVSVSVGDMVTQGDTVGITLDGGMDDLSAAVNAYAVMAATTEPGGVERRASAFLNTLGTSQNMSENLAINWFWPYEVRDGESVIRMDAPDTAMGKDGTYTVTMTPVVRFTQIDTLSLIHI